MKPGGVLLTLAALAALPACNPLGVVTVFPGPKEKPWCYGDMANGCPTDMPEPLPPAGTYKLLTRCPKGSRDYACPALGPAYAPEPPGPDEALVYIYRFGYSYALVSPYVFANGQRLSDLPPEGYFVYRAAPGR